MWGLRARAHAPDNNELQHQLVVRRDAVKGVAERTTFLQADGPATQQILFHRFS
jgi:hypothetical protein